MQENPAKATASCGSTKTKADRSKAQFSSPESKQEMHKLQKGLANGIGLQSKASPEMDPRSTLLFMCL